LEDNINFSEGIDEIGEKILLTETGQYIHGSIVQSFLMFRKGNLRLVTLGEDNGNLGIMGLPPLTKGF
jgi:hypothetical protein